MDLVAEKMSLECYKASSIKYTTLFYEPQNQT